MPREASTYGVRSVAVAAPADVEDGTLLLLLTEEEPMGLSKEEMVQQALLELGEASSQEVSMFIEQRHGVRIEARFIPVLRATLRGKQMLERARQAARAAIQTAENPADDSEQHAVAGQSAENAASPKEPILAAPVTMPSGQPDGWVGS